jgi:hypothetical protein
MGSVLVKLRFGDPRVMAVLGVFRMSPLRLSPHSHRYQLTPLGRRVAVLFTKTYGRVLVSVRSARPSLKYCLIREDL